MCRAGSGTAYAGAIVAQEWGRGKVGCHIDAAQPVENSRAALDMRPLLFLRFVF